ncbi:unnamed protein product [Dracunculus medinensis]|uniref:PH domain-containing protein n=1 Tax=Dracunculus medinensis TaxID=318479 RepID=A0A3P7PWS6_DRAME|nr:unnamed protein product [Dracunculus medinensis]
MSEEICWVKMSCVDYPFLLSSKDDFTNGDRTNSSSIIFEGILEKSKRTNDLLFRFSLAKSKISSNISSVNDEKMWIFAIYFDKGNIKNAPKSSVIYLAAASETEMNQWVAHLCSACNLEKQDDDYCGGIQNLIYSRQGSSNFSISSNSSLNESTMSLLKNKDYTHLKYCSSHPSLSNSGGVASENPEDHAYIHLKDCPPSSYTGMPVIMNMLPNQRFNQGNLFAYGSSCSSSTTSSVDNLPDYFIPPPRPPKHKSVVNTINSVISLTSKDSTQIYSNETPDLDNLLIAPSINETDISEENWSGETITSQNQNYPSEAMSICGGHHVVLKVNPPKVDRSCKPRKNLKKGDILNNPDITLGAFSHHVQNANCQSNLSSNVANASFDSPWVHRIVTVNNNYDNINSCERAKLEYFVFPNTGRLLTNKAQKLRKPFEFSMNKSTINYAIIDAHTTKVKSAY